MSMVWPVLVAAGLTVVRIEQGTSQRVLAEELEEYV